MSRNCQTSACAAAATTISRILLIALGAIEVCTTAVAAPPPQSIRPQEEFTKTFETSGSVLAGLVVAVDPVGSEAHALAIKDPVAAKRARLAYATNFAVAATLRHHVEDGGGDYCLTRTDDRPATASLDDQEARLGIVGAAMPHCVITINHQTNHAAEEPVILVPTRDPQSSDSLAVSIAQVLARRLHDHGFKEMRIQTGTLLAAQRFGCPALELRLPAPPEGKDWRPVPAYTHRLAQALYETWEDCWTSKLRSALQERRQRTFNVSPAERRTEELTPPDGVTTEVAKLAKRLWPFAQAPRDANEAQFVLNSYRRQLTDSTFFYLETEVTRTAQGWNLFARSNVKELAECAEGILRTIGCTPLHSVITVLPNNEALQGQLFGITLATAALTWGAPQEGKDVQTQLLPGELVWLLDRSQDRLFYLIQASDGYVGWVRADAIAPLTEEQFNELMTAPTAVLNAPWSNDRVALSPGTRLPLRSGDGAREISKRSAKDLPLQFPLREGTRTRFDTFHVPAQLCTLTPDLRHGQMAVETALTLYGTPYVFGGRSANGIDCSGLVGISYEAAGLRLPRDARQMVLVGRLAATRWHRDTLMPGDILFFIDKTARVIHTGLSLGGERFIHSCPPCVRVNSFAPTDPLWSKTWSESFVFARRPLD
jgi:hypothetical protein